jgi:hypothetical protein
VAIWDAISNVWSTAGAVGKKVTGGGSFLNKDEEEKAKVLYSNVQNALKDIDEKLSNAPGFGLLKKAGKGTGDILLTIAKEANDKVFSPLVFRPISTLALLTDLNSPLYKKGQYEEGFQFSDIQSAYNRSEKVSAFQALTKSDLIPGFSLLSEVILSTGDIDINKVNLWNDESIKENYADNAVGRWFTGIGDFAISIPVFGGVAKVLKVPLKAGAGKAGLYTSKKTLDELALDFDNGIKYAKTNGVEGAQTRSGAHAVTLSESKDWGLITDLVGKYSTNDRLVGLVHSSSDASVVKDLLLADKGYIPALQRLATTAPEKLFELSDTAGTLSKKFVTSGRAYIPEGQAIPRLKSVYESAIKNDPQFEKLRRAFFDDEYNINPGNKAYMPMEPKLGLNTVIRAEKGMQNLKSAGRYRDYNGIEEVSWGMPGKLGFKFVKFGKATGATIQKPMGYVTFSGLRPLDGRIELQSFLDSMKIFRNGDDVLTTKMGAQMKVSDIRRDFEDRYMRSMESLDEVKVLKEIDAEIGNILAYKHGLFDQAEISSHISSYRQAIDSGLKSFVENGYAIDHAGNLVTTSAQTIRQIRESYRFTPWDKIEQQFGFAFAETAFKRRALKSGAVAMQVLRELNRLWTFDVLARPMYIIKQSFAEPLVSGTMAAGLDFIWKDVAPTYVGSVKNMAFWSGGVASRTLNKKALKKANSAVASQNLIYKKTSQIKDFHEASLKDLLSDATSPATKATHLKAAQNDLAVATKALEEAELNLRTMAGQINAKADFYSATTLQRRLDFLKSKPAISKKAQTQIDKAEKALNGYSNSINKLSTNKKLIQEADAAVGKAYKDIDDIINSLKPALQEQAAIFGKSERFKKRWYGKEKHNVVLSNGEIMNIDSTVAGGPATLSAGVRAEIDTARTATLNVLDEARVGAIGNVIKRKVPTDRVSVTDPTYWTELEYVANRTMIGDPLFDLVLRETDIIDLVKWSKTTQGRTYFDDLGVPLEEQLSAMQNNISLVQRTFPSIEVRALITEQGKITSLQLQKMLASKADELYDIQTSAFNYSGANLSGGAFNPRLGSVVNAVNSAQGAVFRAFAKAENPMRRAYLDRVTVEAMTRKANSLLEQGVKITPGQWNALKQSSIRESIQDLEKTFYTIRRQNKLLFNARLLAAFPQATANAFTRYGRLAKKNPTGASLFVSSYGRMFSTFGVDVNGNPTEEVGDITHIIVPGTKDLGLGYLGEGVALNAKSIGFLLNQPSPSFITAYSMGKIMQKYPGSEESIKALMKVGNIDFFEQFFPYGLPTKIKDVFTPPWGRALYNTLAGGQNQADWVSSYTSVLNYHAMLVETGVQDKMPSKSQIEQEVRALFGEKFIAGFMSMYGVPYKVETNPMRTTTNLYYRLQDQFRAEDKYTEQQVRDLAGNEMIKLLGPKFMVDRVSFSASTSNLNIPKTYEAYARVFEDNPQLALELANISGDDINVLTLLTADLDRNPDNRSDNITKLLANPKLTIPGTSKLVNTLKLTPQEAESQRIKNRTWADYNLIREQIESKIADGSSLRAHPELKAVLDQIIETTLKDQSQSWYDEYQMHASGDTSYKYARALETIVSNDKFMEKNGDNAFWNDAKLFVDSRNTIVQVYQSLPDYDRRKVIIQDYYNYWIEQNKAQWDPNFKDILTRYFQNDTLKAVN